MTLSCKRPIDHENVQEFSRVSIHCSGVMIAGELDRDNRRHKADHHHQPETKDTITS